MKITALSAQQKNKNRVNVFVEGKYRFSLDIAQITELGIKIGTDYTEADLRGFETESQFGKLYTQALEYCLMRPHSSREIFSYLQRKTKARKVKNNRTGEWKEVSGVSGSLVERVYERLIERGFVNDDKFTEYWISNRKTRNGISKRMLMAELRAKGINTDIVEKFFSLSVRSDSKELEKVIAKTEHKYDDPQKFIRYLLRKGFSYEDIKSSIKKNDET